MDYTKHFNTVATPQNQPIPDAKTPQVENSAGGYVWAVDDWTRLDRFLILGSEGGTYYIAEKNLTIDNAQAILRCIKENGPRVVDRVVLISEAGRAPKNDAALFVLALCMKKGDENTRHLANIAMPRVARIGTHIFHLAQYLKGLGGINGSGIMRAFKRWYLEKSPKDLAYQLAKYQSRDGWSHKDLLRLTHPKPKSPIQEGILGWVKTGTLVKEAWDWATEKGTDIDRDAGAFLCQISALQKAVAEKAEDSVYYLLIKEYGLPMECVPNEIKHIRRVWEALLPSMGVTAMLRNLGKMTNVRLLDGNNEYVDYVCKTLTDVEKLKKGKVHPIQVLLALKTYAQGHGVKGSLIWDPVRKIVDALDESFYTAFGTVEPTGKRICYGIDVSSSMVGNRIAGTCIDARTAAAAMALVCARTESSWEMMAFSNKFVPLAISPRQRLDNVMDTMYAIPFGNTDCTIPMKWACENKKEFDAFVVITDSETFASIDGHPAQWLQTYRDKMNIPAKMVVMACCSNAFSIADPDDAGMLDVVGFDGAAPIIVNDFIRG